MQDTGVIVVGAGPTGLMLAGELALRGINVTVIEQQLVPSGQSRGGGVNARTAEVLAMRGLADELMDRAIRREFVGGHFAGLPVALDPRPWRTRFPGGMLIPQDRIEEVLEQHLSRLGVTVHRGHILIALDATTVTATVEGPDGVFSLHGQYLVACDGAHSTVRSLLGVSFPGQPGTMSAVTADITLTSRSASVPDKVGHISQMFGRKGDYWMMLHPLHAPGDDSDLYRIVFGGPEQAALPRTAPVTDSEVARVLTTVHGPDTRLGTIRWGTRFTDATRQISNYRHGRILFAGDAAHIHSPIGGQGLNLGVQDAMNLGWKLAAVLTGAPNDLLTTYHTERHPIAAAVLTLTKAQRVLMSPDPTNHDVLALRDIVTTMITLPDTNRYIAGIMSGLSIRYPLTDPTVTPIHFDLHTTSQSQALLGLGAAQPVSDGVDPLVGMRMPDLALRTADGEVTVSALMSNGHGLLLDLRSDPVDGPVPLGVDRVVAQVVDSEIGTDTGAAADVDQILIRPDGYVCWVGSGPSASPNQALQTWFGTGLEQPTTRSPLHVGQSVD